MAESKSNLSAVSSKADLEKADAVVGENEAPVESTSAEGKEEDVLV